MNVLFTVCGRAGSKGFKNKNLKKMNGVPLVYYTLATIYLFKEKHPDYNIVTAINTDSEELENTVKTQKYVDVVYVRRKNELAGDQVAKVDVIRDTFVSVKEIEAYEFDIVIDLDITSPIRGVDDIERIIEVYIEKEDYDLVFSVVNSRRNPYFNMVELKDNGFYGKVCNSNFVSRQQAPNIYELNASIYAYRPSFIRQEINKTILEYNCGISLMRDYLVLDIDSEEDFIMMERLHGILYKQYSEIGDVFDLAKKMIL